MSDEVLTGQTRRWSRRRAFLVTALIGLAMALVDQTSKLLALGTLSEGERIPLIGDVFGLQLAFNPGTVMSFGAGSTWVFTTISALATIGLGVAATRVPSLPWAVAVGLIWGGAMGNLWDRLAAPPGFGVGHVTDFLAYGDLFIGNLADVALGVGVALSFLLRLLARRDSRVPTPQ